jgi:ATP-binding cassette, subfamily B, bacterial
MNPFIEPVPERIGAHLRAILAHEEPVVIQMASDLNARGQFEAQWLVVTDKRTILIPFEGQEVSVPFEALSEVQLEERVGSGSLVLKRLSGAPISVPFSNSLKPKFAEAASGIRQMSKGEDLVLPEKLTRSRCDKCGRLLPEQDGICPACIRRWDTLKRITAFLKPYKTRVLMLMALAVLTPLLDLVPPQIVRFIIDDALAAGTDLSLLVQLVAALLGVQILNWAFEMGRGWLRGGLASETSMDIRSQLFKHIQFLGLKFFDKRKVGTLISRFTNDADELEMLLLFGIPEVITNVLMMTGILCLLFYMNWVLTLYVLLPVPLIFGASIWIWGYLRMLRSKWHSRWSMLSSQINESITGIRVVKAFAQEGREATRFDMYNNKLRDVSVTWERSWFIFSAVMNFLMSFGVFFVWYFGGRQILEGDLTLGVLMAFISYLWQLYRPLTFFHGLNNFLTRAFAGAERIFEIMDTRNESIDGKDLVDVGRIEGAVTFEGAHFEYERGKPVLKNVDLKVLPGEMIGLVGKSGVGKSTLTSLITRFYDLDQGKITIDGVDITHIPLEALRSQIGMVQQEPFLFNETLFQNIAYSKPDATFDEVVQAAMAAEAHEFIVQKPDGYNMLVGERGNKLSGGEKQRITIARAILQNPRILILDEATSSLDTQTEKKIQAAISRLVSGRTTFAIAHRLSTLRRADRLVVLDDGKVAEEGTHDELMARQGIFYKLVQTQQETSGVVAVGGGKEDPQAQA